MKIKIQFTVQNYNNGPCIRVATNDEVLYDQQLGQKGDITLELDADFKLPNKLIVEHYGKNMKRDTKINSDGKILDDKGVSINNISFDDVSLNYEIYHLPFIKDSGETLLNNNYLGFNGKFIVDVDSENIYQWQSKWQRSLVEAHPEFDYHKFRTEIFGDKEWEPLVY
jgi:hypothetical protein|tara:strand:+ start:121 stop:624 length:504 start_codon:yes stop_codon:yes gene_type:complete